MQQTRKQTTQAGRIQHEGRKTGMQQARKQTDRHATDKKADNQADNSMKVDRQACNSMKADRQAGNYDRQKG